MKAQGSRATGRPPTKTSSDSKGHIYFNAEVLEYVFTFNPKLSRTKELLNHFPEKDQERIANAKMKILRRIWAIIKTVTICSMRIRYLKIPETNCSMPSREMPRSH